MVFVKRIGNLKIYKEIVGGLPTYAVINNMGANISSRLTLEDAEDFCRQIEKERRKNSIYR